MKYDQNFYMNINDTIKNIFTISTGRNQTRNQVKVVSILLNGEDKR